jgi:hypothetical protein
VSTIDNEEKVTGGAVDVSDVVFVVTFPQPAAIMLSNNRIAVNPFPIRLLISSQHLVIYVNRN